MTFSKYDEDFAQAMQTKLKLNREQLNPKATEELAKDNELSDRTEENLTNSIIKQAMEENPDLTYEEADQMMKELGA